MNPALQLATEALWQARLHRAPIAPLRDALAPGALVDAYAVQSANNQRRVMAGAKRIGRKIGLTSVAVQKQLGVDQPDFGILFDDMVYQGPRATVLVNSLMQPRIEGEIAFVTAFDITEKNLPWPELLRCAGHAMAAFEIVDSAIADWKITLADTVADNASCGAIVMGTDRHRLAGTGMGLAGIDIRLAGMVLTQDGDIVSLGVGAASLGDPLAALNWLANLAIDQGDPIRAGEVVLAGALGPMVPLLQGKTYRLEIAGFTPLEVVAQ